MPSFGERLQHAWNAFRNNRDPTDEMKYSPTVAGYSSSVRPDRIRLTRGRDRSIVTAIYNRIAIDVAAIAIRHVRLDENGRYLEDIPSGLNNCLTTEANIDQTGRQFIQDLVMSMLDEGCVAAVPIDTDLSPMESGGYDILSMRVGKITQWFPQDVRVQLYNEKRGIREEIVVPKRMTAIIENPLYSVMNEPNSTLQRLIRKLNLLDIIDEQSGSGKLDMIIQLPYVIKTEQRRAEAERRRELIEKQLSGSKYGIAYTDGTEKVTQLNRPIENNLMTQVEYLTKLLYSQIGMAEEIFNGTADEKTMLNYYNKSIEPIISTICDELKRKFLTKTARTQHQSIVFFREPFKLVPVNNIADIADKFTRNEIMTANEIRSVIGMKPSDDPKADELRNSNMPQQEDQPTEPVDPQQLEEARQILLGAGLTEKDLEGMEDQELIDLADEVKNGGPELEDEKPPNSK